MIELYNGDCRAFLSNYNGERFDAVITDPPYASGGATLSERSASTSQKYTATKKACPFPDFMGDQMDSRSWLHMMADILALARVQCHDGAVLVVFCDWRQVPLLTDALPPLAVTLIVMCCSVDGVCHFTHTSCCPSSG